MDIEKEIEAIKQRNIRVEADKAWERSPMRISLIMVITYILALFVLFVIKVPQFWLAALIPTLGYFLSTQSVPVVKRWWIKKYINK